MKSLPPTPHQQTYSNCLVALVERVVLCPPRLPTVVVRFTTTAHTE